MDKILKLNHKLLVPKSKSLLQRRDFLLSFYPPEFVLPRLNIDSSKERPAPETSQSDSAVSEKLLKSFLTGVNKFYFGRSATAFRFWALRLGLSPGLWQLQGEPDLFLRPFDELKDTLKNLGANLDRIDVRTWTIEGNPTFFLRDHEKKFPVPVSQTSHLLSGLVLIGAGFRLPLSFVFDRGFASRSYFEMTLKFLKSLGHQLEVSAFNQTQDLVCWKGGPKESKETQIVNIFEKSQEPDMSSLFFVMLFRACAAVRGLRFDWENPVKDIDKSLQPDFEAFRIFRSAWDLDLLELNSELDAGLSSSLIREKILSRKNPARLNLSQNIDLYPVLKAFSSVLGGEINFEGVENLKFKESNRIDQMESLLKVAKDGGTFDPSPDHRIAMAASLLWALGKNFKITHMECVSKSFPGFAEVFESAYLRDSQ